MLYPFNWDYVYVTHLIKFLVWRGGFINQNQYFIFFVVTCVYILLTRIFLSLFSTGEEQIGIVRWISHSNKIKFLERTPFPSSVVYSSWIVLSSNWWSWKKYEFELVDK